MNSGLTSADSGLQLDLGDRAKRRLSEHPAPYGLLSRAEDKLKRQDDVIEELCTIIAAIGRALFHALRNPLGALPGSNRQFQFEKRSRLIIRLHNQALTVPAMRQQGRTIPYSETGEMLHLD